MFDIYIRNYNQNGTVISQETLMQTIPATSENALKLVSPIVKCEMGNAEGLDFSIETGTPFYDAFMQMKTYIRIVYDGDTIFYGRVLTIDNNGFRGTRKIRCEGPYSFLLDSPVQGVKETNRSEITILEYMNRLITNHNTYVENDPNKKFLLGEVPGQYSSAVSEAQQIKNDKKKYGSDSWTDTKGALEDLRSHYGGYFRTRTTANGTYLDWMNHYFNASVNAQTVEVGKNILDINDITEIDNIFTAIIPIGKNTKATSKNAADSGLYIEGYRTDVHGSGKLLHVADIAKVYSDAELNSGYHKAENYKNAYNKYGMIIKTVSFNDATTQEKLFNDACEWIKNNYQGEVTKFTIKAIDMHQIGENTTKIMVGDQVNIIYPVGKEDGSVENRTIKLTCLSISYDLYHPENNSYTFGIPANVLTKTYGLHKNGKSLTSGASSPKPGDSGTGSEPQTPWIDLVRGWLQHHRVYYDGPKPYQEKYGSTYQRGEYMYLSRIDSGDGHVYLVHGHRHMTGSDKDGHIIDIGEDEKVTPEMNYQGGIYWTPTLDSVSYVDEATIYKNKVIEWVLYEYGIDLRTFLSTKAPAFTVDEEGNITITKDIVNPDTEEIQSIRKLYYDNASNTIELYDENGDNQVIRAFLDENNNWTYWYMDKEGKIQPTSIRDLSIMEINNNRKIGWVVQENEQGDMEFANPGEITMAIENFAGGEMVVTRIAGEQTYLGNTKTQRLTSVSLEHMDSITGDFSYVPDEVDPHLKVLRVNSGAGMRNYHAVLKLKEEGLDPDDPDNWEYEYIDDPDHPGEKILNMAEYGVYDKNTLVGGIVSTMLNDGTVYTKVRGDVVDITVNDDFSRLTINHEGLTHIVGDNTTNISILQNTTGGLESRVESVERDASGMSQQVSTLTNTVRGMNNTVENLDGRTSTLENTIDGMSSTVIGINNEVSTLKNTVDGLENDVSDNKGNIATLTNTATGLTSRVENTENNISTLTNTANGLTSRVENAEGQVATLSNTVNGMESRVESAERDASGAAQQVSTLSNTVDGMNSTITNLDGRASTLENTVDGMSSTVTGLNGQVSTLTNTVDGMNSTVTSLDGRTSTLENTVDGMSSTVTGLNGQVSTLTNTVDGMNSTVTSLDGRTSTLENTVDGMSSTVTGLNGQVSTLTNTVDGMSSTVSSLDGRTSTLENTVDGMNSTVIGLDGQMSTLTNTVDGMNSTVSSLDGRTSTLENTVDGMNSTVTGLNGQISTLTNTVDGMNSTVSSLDGQVSSLTNTVDGMNSTVSSLDGRTSTLENTVDGMNSTVTGLNGQVSTLTNTVDGMSSTVSSLDGQVSSLTNTVDGMNSTVSSLDGRTSTLENTVDGMNSTVTGLNGQVSTLTNTVNGMSSTVNGIDGRVSSLSNTVDGFEAKLEGVVDENGNVTAASIATAINSQGQAGVKISGAYVTIGSGNVKISDAMTIISSPVTAVGFQYPVVFNDSISISNKSGNTLSTASITLSGSNSIELTSLNMANAIKDASVDIPTNTLTLTRFDGTTVTFKKAASINSLTGAWSGTGNDQTLTVSTDPSTGKTWTVGFGDYNNTKLRLLRNGTPTINTDPKYLDVPMQVATVEGSGSVTTTPRYTETFKVNATPVWNNGNTTGIQTGYDSARMLGIWDANQPNKLTISKTTDTSYNTSYNLYVVAGLDNLSYSTTTHKYTTTAHAKAGTSAAGATDRSTETKTSGLEAYYDGKASVNLSDPVKDAKPNGMDKSRKLTISTIGRTDSSGTSSEISKAINLRMDELGWDSGTNTVLLRHVDNAEYIATIDITATNLTAVNIKSGENVCGITGTYYPTITSVTCENYTDDPTHVTKTAIPINATASNGATGSKTVYLVSTTKSYSSGGSFHCVELREGSTTGTAKGRVNIESVYTEGSYAGKASVNLSDPVKDAKPNGMDKSRKLTISTIGRTDSSGTSSEISKAINLRMDELGWDSGTNTVLLRHVDNAEYIATIDITDANLVAENIKSGVNVCGITGTYVTSINSWSETWDSSGDVTVKALPQNQSHKVNTALKLEGQSGTNCDVALGYADTSGNFVATGKKVYVYLVSSGSGTSAAVKACEKSNGTGEHANISLSLIPGGWNNGTNIVYLRDVSNAKYIAQTSVTDVNLSAGNIKSGVTVCGITGTYSGTTPTVRTRFDVNSDGYYILAYDNQSGDPFANSSVKYKLGMTGSTTNTTIQIQNVNGVKIDDTPQLLVGTLYSDGFTAGYNAASGGSGSAYTDGYNAGYSTGKSDEASLVRSRFITDGSNNYYIEAYENTGVKPGIANTKNKYKLGTTGSTTGTTVQIQDIYGTRIDGTQQLLVGGLYTDGFTAGYNAGSGGSGAGAYMDGYYVGKSSVNLADPVKDNKPNGMDNSRKLTISTIGRTNTDGTSNEVHKDINLRLDELGWTSGTNKIYLRHVDNAEYIASINISAADLSADKIKSGENVCGITGTYYPTITSVTCENYTDDPTHVTKTAIPINATASNGATGSKTVYLVSTTKSYSSGGSFHCVELREGSTTGTAKGRVNIESVYTEGSYAGKASVNLADPVKDYRQSGLDNLDENRKLTVWTVGRTNASGTSNEDHKDINMKLVEGGWSSGTNTVYLRYVDNSEYIAKLPITHANLKASNIKSGVTVCGITGTYSGADSVKLLPIWDSNQPNKLTISKTTNSSYGDTYTLYVVAGLDNLSYSTTTHTYSTTAHAKAGTSASSATDRSTESKSSGLEGYYDGKSSVSLTDPVKDYRPSGLDNLDTSRKLTVYTSGRTNTSGVSNELPKEINLRLDNLGWTSGVNTVLLRWVDGYEYIAKATVTDTNLTAENIKSGVTVCGITGTYSGTTPTHSISVTTTSPVSDQTPSAVTEYIRNATKITFNSNNVSATNIYSKYYKFTAKCGTSSKTYYFVVNPN